MAPRHPGLLAPPAIEAEDNARALAKNFNKSLPKDSPGNTLMRALAIKETGGEEESDEQMWVEIENLKTTENLPSRTANDLDEAKGEMVEVWRDLVATFPAEDKPVKRSRNPIEAISNIFSPHVPDKPKDENEGMISKFKTTLQDLCKTLDDFSDVFRFFPSDDKYVAIVTGVLTTVVQATVRHREIDSGFTSGLGKIRSELQYCLRVGELFKDVTESRKLQDLQTIVARFFTEVFKFLIPYVKWCKSRLERSKASLNKNYYEDFVNGPLKDITSQVRMLEREVNLQTAMDVKKIGANLERRKKTLGNSDNYQQGMETMGGSIQLLVVAGEHGTDLNTDTALRAIVANLKASSFQINSPRKPTQEEIKSYREFNSHSPSAVESHSFPSSKIINDTAIPWKAVERASDHLEVFSEENGYPLDDVDPQEKLQAKPQVFSRLMDWTMASESQTLWICGPLCNESPSEISLAAAYMVLLAEQANVPLIAYRCRIKELGLADLDSEIGHRSLAMDRLVLMVYSLIRQLIWLLPDTVKTKNDFSTARFVALDASSTTLLDALNLLEELLLLAPKVLICVLDGLQFVDNDSDILNGTGGYLEVLFDILRNARADRVLKVLFASNGRCLTLDDERNLLLEEQLQLMSDRDDEQRRLVDELEWFF